MLLNNCGHWPPFEKPAEWGAHVLASSCGATDWDGRRQNAISLTLLDREKLSGPCTARTSANGAIFACKFTSPIGLRQCDRVEGALRRRTTGFGQGVLDIGVEDLFVAGVLETDCKLVVLDRGDHAVAEFLVKDAVAD